MSNKLNNIVTIGKYRVYYQSENEYTFTHNYIAYSGRSFTGKFDLIHGLDKLVVI